MAKRDQSFNSTGIAILNYQQNLLIHMENRSSWLFSTSFAILVFMIANLQKFSQTSLTRAGALIVILSCFLSAIIFLFNLIPHFKTPQRYQLMKAKRNLFSFPHFGREFDAASVRAMFKEMQADHAALDKQIADKLYELAAYRLADKSERYRAGGLILAFGALIGALLIALGYLS